VLIKSVGESLACEDAVADVVEGAAQARVAPALIAQRLQRLIDGHARRQHRGELAEKHRQRLEGHAAEQGLPHALLRGADGRGRLWLSVQLQQPVALLAHGVRRLQA
jgi:hypothetical protein